MTSAALRLARLVVDDPPRAVAEASRLLIAAKQKRQRVLTKSAPRRKAEKAESLAVRDRRVLLTMKVHSRPGYMCELGEHNGPMGELDVHHLEGGSGKRQANERIWNLIRACRADHDAFHMAPASYVAPVKRWCALHGYPIPNRKEYR